MLWRRRRQLKTAQLIEGAWPYFVGPTIFVAWRFGLEATFPAKIEGLLAASGAAAAVLIGFLSTAKAVLLGLSSLDALQILKKAKFLGLFHRYVFEAIWGGIAFLIFVTVGVFVAGDAGAPYWYQAGWVLIGAIVVAQYIRVTQLFFALLKKV